MNRPTNLKAGDKFRVIKAEYGFYVGETISLKRDDGSNCPPFWNADKSDYYCIPFSNLEPVAKTIRDVQVGDVVVGKTSGLDYLVLERGQNTVLLSQRNNFKKASENFTFDELEENYTLKDAPEVVDDKTAEAMKLLKEAGYKVTKD